MNLTVTLLHSDLPDEITNKVVFIFFFFFFFFLFLLQTYSFMVPLEYREIKTFFVSLRKKLSLSERMEKTRERERYCERCFIMIRLTAKIISASSSWLEHAVTTASEERREREHQHPQTCPCFVSLSRKSRGE